MTLVKGPNGLVFDVAPSVASGLIGGGHVVAVENSDADVAESSTEDDETEADQDQQSDEQVESSGDDSDESSTDTPAAPSGNASRGDWEAYALAQGFAEEQLDGLKRDEIRALFDE